MPMDSLFRAAKQNRIFQDVVEQIQDAIMDGRLNVGDKLPAERELKEMLQTSRSTLREALRVLEQKGLIEIKLGVGGGAVVKSVSSDQVSESLGLLIRSQKVSLNHLAEFRETIEGDVVAHAATRANESDLKDLKYWLQKAAECVNSGEDTVNEFLRADKALHLCFAKITKNPVYISVLKTVHDNIKQYFDSFLLMEYREMKENLQDLRDIVQAVENRNPDKARMLAQAHVRKFNQYMKKSEQRDLN